ncbi:MAG: hypothetical protein ACYDDW_10970 [Dermatophilaceae bacterium]
MTGFALLTLFISNPFRAEVSAGATPDFAKLMFLHGLLIGMVGLFALLTLQVFKVRSMQARVWISAGAVVATVLASVGGIFDTKIHGSEVALWTHISGFFALDAILVVMVYAIVREYKHGVSVAGRLPVVVAALAAASMFGAAVMGHVAGWLMEFGETPGVVASYRSFAGFKSVDDWSGALVGSHSHEMAVSAMALVVTLAAVQFGYKNLAGASRNVARVGMGMIAAGVVGTSALYLLGGFTTVQVPGFLTDGITFTNGSIPPDDLFIGVLVMGGGVVVMAAFLKSLVHSPVRLAAAWAWVLSFATVAVAGYAIEVNTANFFGAGDAKAKGAANDAIFTWMHQDIGLFLLPTILAVMLAVELLVSSKARSKVIGLAAIVGTALLFVGGMVWVFVSPTLYGPGYIISTAGMLVVGATLLATIYYSLVGHRHGRVKVVPPSSSEHEHAV